MIPSDHFVRFYNEVFKYLDAHGGLEEYYSEISHHQEFHCLKMFREEGIQGIYEYYVKIRKEENCEMDLERIPHGIVLRMNKCPSLSKVLDNDGTASPKYCLHCPGWTAPLYKKADLYQVYYLQELDNPQCCEWIYDNLECARAKYEELQKTCPPEQLLKNF